MFSQEEITTAKATRDAIIKEGANELKSVYMAGEIVMWDELQKAAPAPSTVSAEEQAEELWDEHSFLVGTNIDELDMVAGSCVMKETAFKKAIIQYAANLEGENQRLREALKEIRAGSLTGLTRPNINKLAMAALNP